MPDLLYAVLPILFLIHAMTKPNPVPSAYAFLFGAIIAMVIGLVVFKHPPPLLGAAVISGLLDALTPISIVFGAIFFFVALEKSGAMGTLRSWLREVSPNPVAQIMIAGWSFIFLIEGAAGFGTPAALAAPILVGLGFPALRVAVVCLIFNTISTAFGAAGTPVWFGFEQLHLPREEMLLIGRNAAILQSAAALIVPVVAVGFLVDRKTIFRNAGFIYLSILASIIPMAAVALMNYEFPAIVGGIVGMPMTILFARYGIGLAKSDEPPASSMPMFSRTVWLAMLPLLVTVAILLITRIPALGLRALLTAAMPAFSIPLGGFGEFSISASLVLQLRDILGQGLSWSHALLYVPSIIPFVFTAALAFLLGRCKADVVFETLHETSRRLVKPVFALFGALVFVKLLMIGDERSATMILGNSLASATGQSWKFFASFLGALGSFFSGSTTISNLTFGPIQLSVAADTGVSVPLLLALQLSGAAMGNMLCIHNIVAVCAVLSLHNSEGKILKMAALPALLFGLVLAAIVLSGLLPY